MAIDPSITVERYLREELAFCEKFAARNCGFKMEDSKIQALDFSTLTGEQEFAGVPIKARNYALIEFDPFAEKVDAFVGSRRNKFGNLGPCYRIHGFFPHVGWVAPQSGHWYRWPAVILQQFMIKFKFFVLTRLHWNEKVREEARKIQILVNEIHIGALALDSSRVNYNMSLVGNPSKFLWNCPKMGSHYPDNNQHLDDRLWNFRLMEVARYILQNKSPAFL